jgi:hypothetical protein
VHYTFPVLGKADPSVSYGRGDYVPPLIKPLLKTSTHDALGKLQAIISDGSASGHQVKNVQCHRLCVPVKRSTDFKLKSHCDFHMPMSVQLQLSVATRPPIPIITPKYEAPTKEIADQIIKLIERHRASGECSKDFKFKRNRKVIFRISVSGGVSHL